MLTDRSLFCTTVTLALGLGGLANFFDPLMLLA
jgi:hypothetical protein